MTPPTAGRFVHLSPAVLLIGDYVKLKLGKQSRTAIFYRVASPTKMVRTIAACRHVLNLSGTMNRLK